MSILLCAVLLSSGCESLLGLLRPTSTRVSLVNNGDFDVQVRLFTSSEQEIPEDLLTEVGNEREFTIAPGGTMSFSDDCDDLQAVIVDDADLQLIGEIGPEANSDVLRDGDDFGCGDTIIFTFDHSGLIVDFDVSVSVQQFGG